MRLTESTAPMAAARTERFDRSRLAVLLAGLFLAAYALGLAVPSESYLRFQSNVLYHVPALVGMVFVGVRAARSTGRARLGWLCLWVVLLTWDAADWVYTYYDLVLGQDVPFPGLTDILYYLGYLSFGAAIPLLVIPDRKAGDTRWVLDAAIVMTVAGTLSWVFIIEPTVRLSDSSPLAAATALGYPLADLGILAALALSFLRAGSRFTRLSIVIGAAALTQIVADSAYAYFVLVSGYDNAGNPMELGWLAAYLLIGVAAVLPREAKPLSLAPRQSMLGLALPYLPTLPLVALSLSLAFTDSVTRADELFFGTMVAGGLVVGRQILTLRDRTMIYNELEQTVLMLATAAEAHDETTGRHLLRVRELTEALALELGYSPKEAADLGLAAVLHDVGKFNVPDSLLVYPGKLDAEQWRIMQGHTTWAGLFLQGRDGFETARIIALCHHERWDGKGYPSRLAREEIPEIAAIVSVADAFDAMTTDRPYKEAMSAADAVDDVLRCSGTQFSPAVVEAFQRLWTSGAHPAFNPMVEALQTDAPTVNRAA